MLLDEAGKQRVAAAIQEAERSTAGEIVCIVERRLEPRPSERWLVGAMGALAFPPLVLVVQLAWSSGWSAGHVATQAPSTLLEILILQVVCFGLSYALAGSRSVRRLLEPTSVLRDRVHRAAMRHFVSRGVHQTRDRTGILLFVVEEERRAEVVADEGIASQVDPSVWSGAIDALVAGAHRGDVAGGFEEAIARCGAVLAQHFPPRPDDVDELANHLVVLD